MTQLDNFIDCMIEWFPTIVMHSMCMCVYVCMYVCMYVDLLRLQADYLKKTAVTVYTRAQKYAIDIRCNQCIINILNILLT